MRSQIGPRITFSHLELGRRGRRSFPFLPGLFFISLGVIVLLAPRLFIAVLAAAFFFFGAILCYVAWKFVHFKRHLGKLARELEGKIQVQAFHVPGREREEPEVDEKKIVFH